MIFFMDYVSGAIIPEKYYEALVSFDVPEGVEITLTNRQVRLSIPGENPKARDKLYAVIKALHESIEQQMEGKVLQ